MYSTFFQMRTSKLLPRHHQRDSSISASPTPSSGSQPSCSILCAAEQIEKGSAAVLAYFSSIGAMCGLAFVVFVKKGRASWWGHLGRLIWPPVGIVTVLGLVVVVHTAWKDCWEWEQLVMEERNRVKDGRAERRQARKEKKALSRKKQEDLENAGIEVGGEALI
jgi:hypothetical protein